MLQLLFDGSKINFVTAFAAGVMTFFASCLLPLVPTYLAYLSGVSINDQQLGKQRWLVLTMGAWFVLGFTITFVALGLLLNQLAAVLVPYRQALSKAAGLLFIGLGAMMLGAFNHPLFSRELRFNFKGFLTRFRWLHALLTGVAFGVGWSPCIGPVLAVILFWTTRAQTAALGTSLLVVYALGIGTPFLILALGFEKITPLLKKQTAISRIASVVSGLIVFTAGVLLLLGQFESLSLYLLKVLQINPYSG